MLRGLAQAINPFLPVIKPVLALSQVSIIAHVASHYSSIGFQDKNLSGDIFLLHGLVEIRAVGLISPTLEIHQDAVGLKICGSGLLLNISANAGIDGIDSM